MPFFQNSNINYNIPRPSLSLRPGLYCAVLSELKHPLQYTQAFAIAATWAIFCRSFRTQTYSTIYPGLRYRCDLGYIGPFFQNSNINYNIPRPSLSLRPGLYSAVLSELKHPLQYTQAFAIAATWAILCRSFRTQTSTTIYPGLRYRCDLGYILPFFQNSNILYNIPRPSLSLRPGLYSAVLSELRHHYSIPRPSLSLRPGLYYAVLSELKHPLKYTQASAIAATWAILCRSFRTQHQIQYTL